jgi:hypothetical protein
MSGVTHKRHNEKRVERLRILPFGRWRGALGILITARLKTYRSLQAKNVDLGLLLPN